MFEEGRQREEPTKKEKLTIPFTNSVLSTSCQKFEVKNKSIKVIKNIYV